MGRRMLLALPSIQGRLLMPHVWMDDEIGRCACCARGYRCDCHGEPCGRCGKCEEHCWGCAAVCARDMEADHRMDLEAEGE